MGDPVDVCAAKLQEELDRVVDRAVRPLTSLCIVIFALLAVLTALFGQLQRPFGMELMVGLALASCVVLLVFFVQLRRKEHAPARSHLYVGGLSLLIIFTSSARLYLTDDPSISIAAIVMTVVWGLFILMPRVLIATQLVQVGLWGLVALVSSAPSIAWIRMGVGLAIAIAIAHLLQRVRLKGIRSEVEQREALTSALAEVEARTAELTAANDALSTSNAELDAFTRTVAHDLKTPLGTITGYAMILREDWRELDDEERDTLLERVESTGHKLAEIIDELLLLASVRDEQVRHERLEMGSIVQGALGRLKDLIASSGSMIETPERWPAARGYGPWIEAVWTNYISNAIKYGGKPPVIVLGAEPLDGRVRFWIRDNGRGLKAEEQALLFTPFSRLGSDHEVMGHGLGLSIVERIIDKLGGEVAVTSTPGEGCEFSFTLRADAGEGSPLRPSSPPSSRPSSDADGAAQSPG